MFVQLSNLRNLIIDADNIDVSFYSDYGYEGFFKQNLEHLNVIILYKNFWYRQYYQNLDVHQRFVYVEEKSSFFSVSEILNTMNIDSYKSVIITGNQQVVKNAHSNRLSTILVTRDMMNIERTALPDYIVTNSSDLKLILMNARYGYYNEMMAEGLSSVGYINSISEIRHSLFPEIKAYLLASGRYFTSKDPRAYTHCLTNKILKLKDYNQVIAGQLAYILSQNLYWVANYWGNINFITIVPPRPNSNSHLAFLLGSRTLDNYNSNLIDTDILYTTRYYSKQKEAGSWENRAHNVSGVFASKKRVYGHVVIVDDILTSGSTTLECAKVLYENGAQQVSIVPLSIMQSQVNPYELDRINCPTCAKGILKLKFNHRYGTPFWGCDHYPECKTTREYYPIRNDYNSRSTLNSNHEEINF